MKVLLTLLAFYMMALQMMPCADMLPKDPRALSDRQSELTASGDHNHADTADFCSPFCICNCCGTISGALWNVVEVSSDMALSIPALSFAYTFPYVPDCFGDIWQPSQGCV